MRRRRSRRILIIDAHPHRNPRHLVHGLARAYEAGARDKGHEVRRVALSEIDIPLLASRQDWEEEPPPPALKASQDALRWAEHVAIFFPLWLGDMPALLKAFLEQVLRPGFAFEYREGRTSAKALKGRSARIIVTMGMPGLFYRLYFGAHAVRLLRRNILHFVGIRPVRATIIGGVEAKRSRNADHLRHLVKLGERAA